MVDYDIQVFESHPRVLSTVSKHCNTWNKYVELETVASHTIVAFSEAEKFVDSFYRDKSNSSDGKLIILDSGCGVGLSSLTLALANPTLPVIGVDRSIVRLTKNRYAAEANFELLVTPPNLLLVRAELVGFWLQAALRSDWRVVEHYLLYPNPYPKSKHLQRRWHG